MNIEKIAEVAHEANRAYAKTLGDNSHLDWRDAPDWQRESAIAGVKAHLTTDMTPEQSHELWLAHKLADGWRYGQFKDVLKKEHPCCVPYNELSDAHKVKDFLFGAVVKALRSEVDLPEPAAVQGQAAPVPEAPVSDVAEGETSQQGEAA